MTDGDWAEFGRRMTQVAERTLQRGRARSSITTTWARSSRARPRSTPHGGDRRAGASAARHRPRDLGRRRPGGAGAALSQPHQPRPRQGRAPRRDGAGEGARAGASSMRCIAGVYTVPGDGMVDYRVGVHASCRAIPAGSWSRPSRIPKKAHPLTYAKMGYANLTPLPQGSRPARKELTAMSKLLVKPSQARCRAGASMRSRRKAPAGPMSASRSTGCKAGRACAGETGDREACLVLLSGRRAWRPAGAGFRRDRRAHLAVRGASRGRSTCRPRSHWSLTAETDCELAVCTAPARAASCRPA